jgi:hypothetical protein
MGLRGCSLFGGGDAAFGVAGGGGAVTLLAGRLLNIRVIQ